MVIDFSVLYSLKEFAGVHYLLATLLAFLVASVFNFLGQKTLTFKNKQSNYGFQASSFLLVGLVGMGINLLVVFVFVRALGLWYMFGKIVAVGIAFIWNFFANKFITFK